MGINRRKFIKIAGVSALGLAGGATAPRILRADDASEVLERGKP